MNAAARPIVPLYHALAELALSEHGATEAEQRARLTALSGVGTRMPDAMLIAALTGADEDQRARILAQLASRA